MSDQSAAASLLAGATLTASIGNHESVAAAIIANSLFTNNAHEQDRVSASLVGGASVTFLVPSVTHAPKAPAAPTIGAAPPPPRPIVVPQLKSSFSIPKRKNG